MKNLIEKYNKMSIVLKASIWFMICSIIQKGISVLTMPVFTRTMTIEQYGDYSIYLAWYNILSIIVTLSVFKEVFNKGLIDNNDNKDSFTANVFGYTLFLSIFFFVLFSIFGDFFYSFSRLKPMFKDLMFIEIVSNVIIALWLSRKRFSYEYKKVFFVTILLSIVNVSLGLIFVYLFADKVFGRILSAVILPVLISIILLVYYRSKGKFFSKQTWSYITRKSLPLLPHYLSLVLLNQVDRIMINNYIGSKEAAIYSIAHSAGLIMVLVNDSLNGSFVPWAYRKLKDGKVRELREMIESLLYIVLAVNVILIWFSPEFVRVLAPKEYYSSIWGIFPIAISVFCCFVYSLFVDIEIYYNGNSFVTIASIIACIVNVVLNYIFIPKYGYISAAYTTLFSYFFTMIIHYFFMNYILKKNKIKNVMFRFKYILALFVIMIIISTAGILMYSYFLLRILTLLILLITTYFYRKKILNILVSLRNKGEVKNEK